MTCVCFQSLGSSIRQRIVKYHIEGEREGMRNDDSSSVSRPLGMVTRLLSGLGGGKMPRLVARRRGEVALES